MITFVLDQGLPRSAADHLRAAGFLAVHVSDISMACAADSEILKYGIDHHAIVVTIDADFHALLARHNANAPSMIRIRIEGLRGEASAKLLIEVFQRCHDDLLHGAAVTVEEQRVRVRRLPLIG